MFSISQKNVNLTIPAINCVTTGMGQNLNFVSLNNKMEKEKTIEVLNTLITINNDRIEG